MLAHLMQLTPVWPLASLLPLMLQAVSSSAQFAPFARRVHIVLLPASLEAVHQLVQAAHSLEDIQHLGVQRFWVLFGSKATCNKTGHWKR